MKRLALAITLVAAGQSHAATIYLCKAYNGARFWTSTTCSSHNALVERIETVADLPFNQQVEQARSTMNRSNNTTTSTSRTAAQDQYCGQLINELNEIEGRYTKGNWQPVETVNYDQKRTIAIRSQLRANNCRLQ